MSRPLTIDILYDALQNAVTAGLIQDWSVDGMRVILCKDGEIFDMPALKARAYLESLVGQEKIIHSERVEIASRLHCMQKRRYVLEGLLDDRLDLEAFRSLVETAVRDLTELKRMRLERQRLSEGGYA